jgi:hypothetical protein
MYLSFVTGNILQKITEDTYNIIYYPQNNMIDHCISAIDKHRYYMFGANKIDFQIENMIDLPDSHLSLYNYNLCITNRILNYINNPTVKQFHLNTIILTHSHKPQNIKKEDTLLMSQRLKKEIKVFFSESSKDSWRLDNSIVLKYGVPSVFNVVNDTSKRKDVLILNYENLPHAQQIQAALINKNYSCDIMTSCRMPIENINNMLNNYKACIDLAEHNIFNLLCGVASGCTGLSIRSPTISEEYLNVNGLTFLNSVDEIFPVLSQVLDIGDEERKNSSDDILKKFDFDNFSSKMRNIIQKANREAFTL